MASPEYTWDAKLARYRNSAGRIVPRADVVGALERALDVAKGRARDLGASLRAGNISLAAWQQGMRVAIKDVHLYSAAVARGGWAQMTSEDFGYVGPRVRFHYGKLQAWAEQLQAGAAPLDGRFTTRTELYLLAGRGSFDDQDLRQQQEIGMQYERNILHAADHCFGCLEQSDRGWVPIGQLVRPGQRECMSRCRCTVAYRAELAQA
jgi:hypothetical protein